MAKDFARASFLPPPRSIVAKMYAIENSTANPMQGESPQAKREPRIDGADAAEQLVSGLLQQENRGDHEHKE